MSFSPDSTTQKGCFVKKWDMNRNLITMLASNDEVDENPLGEK